MVEWCVRLGGPKQLLESSIKNMSVYLSRQDFIMLYIMRDAVTMFVTDLSVTHGAEELPHVVEQGAHHRLCVRPGSENVFKTFTFRDFSS